jgi:4-alpha-glucanotransferase
MTLAAGRHTGVLVPLFSMPSRASWGIGEIGDIPLLAAWLRSAGQDLLQLLPIHEMAVGQRSPYSAMTAMAIDPILISVHSVAEFRAMGGEAAMDREWRNRLAEARRSTTIDHALVRSVKEPALRASFDEFVRRHWRPETRRARTFQAWDADQLWWLEDYALFRALHAHEADRPWTEWPEALRVRDRAELERARHGLADEILYRKWLQFVADTQWHEAKALAQPISLLGDLAFMVDLDSADVWSHASSFRLDASVGAPPDAFSEKGQRWGMPVYRWDAMAGCDFAWLRQRARRTASLFDGYRVDHLVGFYRTYMFPNDGAPASFTPADEAEQLELGETVLSVLGQAGATIIAEDLGTVPDFVRESLARLGVPGFKVFRWERHWTKNGQPYRNPSEYPELSVATSGTHDTDTTAAWWDGLGEDERAAVLGVPDVAERVADLEDAAGDFTPELRDVLLEVLFASGSDFLLLPIQDVFGWRDRVNIPADLGPQNWTWRLPWPIDLMAREPEAQERAAALRSWSVEYRRGKPAGRERHGPSTQGATVRTALRTLLALIVGFVVASAIMMAVETANGKVFYPELGKAAQGVTDREAVRQLLAAAPLGALLVVLAGWALGTMSGGWLAARIGGRAPSAHAIAVGVIIALAGIANNLMIPPPVWFWVAGLFTPLAAGVLTARMVRANDTFPK